MTTATLEPKAEANPQTSKSTMKALVYRTAGNGAGRPSWEDQPHPAIQHPEDAIVKITTTTICGTDLHILKGNLPAVTDGRILGHEGIGVIEKIGSGVTSFKPGDKVIISCVTACMKCDFCRKGMLSHCRHGGWILGNLINGTQAEYVRIPYADGSLYHFPEGSDEEAMVMLSDALGRANSHRRPRSRLEPRISEKRLPRASLEATLHPRPLRLRRREVI